jgi:hypothetical protein
MKNSKREDIKRIYKFVDNQELDNIKNHLMDRRSLLMRDRSLFLIKHPTATNRSLNAKIGNFTSKINIINEVIRDRLPEFYKGG